MYMLKIVFPLSVHYFSFRDGLRESNIVTKTFVVDDAGPPDENVDLESLIGAKEEIVEEIWDPAPTTKKRQVSFVFVFILNLCAWFISGSIKIYR